MKIIAVDNRVFRKEIWPKKESVKAGWKKQHEKLYYLGADKSLARPTSRCILFDGENISFDASLGLYIYIYIYIYI